MKHGCFPRINRRRRRRVRNHVLGPHENGIVLRDERVDVNLKELGNAPQVLVDSLAWGRPADILCGPYLPIFRADSA